MSENAEDRSKEPIRCYHCNKWYSNWNSLMAHLQHCTERKLKRYFVFPTYRFILLMNPRHRYVKALKDLQAEYPAKEQLFLGAVMFMKKAGLIHEFAIEETKESSLEDIKPENSVA